MYSMYTFDTSHRMLSHQFFLCWEWVKFMSYVNTIFCSMISTGLTDGIIRTYDLFTAYNPGYFQLEILACDFVGHSTTTNVNIYILRDDQRVKIVFNEIPDLVRENQEDFVNLLSNITGAIVNLDDIQARLFYGTVFMYNVQMADIFVSLSFYPVPCGQEGQGELCTDWHADPCCQQSDQHHPRCWKVYPP